MLKKRIAVVAIAAMALTMVPVPLFAATADSTRLAGVGRVETALKVSEAGWDSTNTVILAPADDANLVDALAAAPLAGQENAPILVTPKDSLNFAVKEKLKDLGAKKVYVIGAISTAVGNEVASLNGITVIRLGGDDRIETAGNITKKLVDPAGTFVVGYQGMPDALSVTSYAAANNFAIAIANPDGSIDKEDLVGDTTYIVGGTSRVDDIPGVKRFAGSDRYATNTAVAEGLGFTYDKLYVANGETLVDALSVAPLAAKTDSFVSLCTTSTVLPVEGITDTTQVIAVGGSGVVPTRVIDKLVPKEEVSEGEVSVEAANLLQLTLDFADVDFDEEAVEDEDNYSFEGDVNDESVEVDVLEVAVDGSMVTLTLEQAVDNQSTGELVIDEAVSGKELTLEDIEFLDREMPTVEEVEVIGRDTVKVTFSEPVVNLGSMGDEFEIEMDGDAYNVDEVTALKHGLEANISVYGDFEEGTLTLNVGNGLEDYAGFNVVIDTFDVQVVEDNDPPEVVSYKDVTKQQVTLVFDEDIQIEDAAQDNYYHTNDGNTIDADIDLANDLEGNELTLNFSDNSLPEGTGYVYIESGSVSDLWDNENESIRVQVKIELDETAPTVKDVDYDSDNNAITVTFSEEMDEGTAEDVDNYILEDKNGVEVDVSRALLDGDEVRLQLRNNDPDRGTYQLGIEDVEDESGNEIAPNTYEVVIADTEGPEYPTNVYYDGSNSDYTLYVEFSEEMAVSGTYAINDLFKYEVFDKSADKYINLGRASADGDFDVELTLMEENQTVKLTLDGFELDPEEDTFVIARVADPQGNTTGGFSSSALSFVDMADKTIRFAEDGIVATDQLTLEVTFNESLDDFDVDDFFIASEDGQPGAYTIASLEAVDDQEIILTLDEDTPLSANLKDDEGKLYLATRGGSGDRDYTIKTENSSGAKLEAGLSEPIIDEILPTVVEEDNKKTSIPYIDVEGNGSEDDVPVVYATYYNSSDLTLVTVEFTEPLEEIVESMIVVNDGDQELIDGGVILNGTNGTLQFMVEGELYQGDEIEIILVRDKAGNYTTSLNLQIEYEVDEE